MTEAERYPRFTRNGLCADAKVFENMVDMESRGSNGI